MRGKVGGGLGHAVFDGITPAYAGKSAHSPDSVHSHEDHPRVCGEKYDSYEDYKSDQGSPPRMRGKDLSSITMKYPVGITPAYAGKSFCPQHSDSHARDHPRVCGEKYEAGLCSQQPGGSPPRMRGKDDAATPGGGRYGITPAYAGKRHYPELSTGLPRDHPRVCGEKA